MTLTAKEIDRCKAWQASPHVHPMLCGQCDSDKPLVVLIDGAGMKCTACRAIQTYIPPQVLAGPPPRWGPIDRSPYELIAEAMWRIHVPEAKDWAWGLDVSAAWSDRYRAAAKTVDLDFVTKALAQTDPDKAPARPDGDINDLPDGLFMKGGHIHFTCRVCGEASMWPGEIDQFDIDDPHNVCGGSPRCCP